MLSDFAQRKTVPISEMTQWNDPLLADKDDVTPVYNSRQNLWFWANIWLHRVLSTLRPARCYQHSAAGQWKVVTTLTAGSKRHSLLMAGDDDEMFMTRSLNVTPKTTEQHLTARSDKSVLCSLYVKRLLDVCTIEAGYWQIWSTRGLFATAELLVFHVGVQVQRSLCVSGVTRRWHGRYHISKPPTSISNSRQTEMTQQSQCSQNSESVVRKQAK